MDPVEQRLTELERRLVAVESERTAFRVVIAALGRAASTYEQQVGCLAESASGLPSKPGTATVHSLTTPEVKIMEVGTSPPYAPSITCSSNQSDPSVPTSTRLYVDRLINGRKSEGWFSPGAVSNILASARHDLVVHEPNNKLMTRNQGKCTTKTISQLPRRIQDMAWLTLTSVGYNLTYDRIAKHLDLKYADQPGALDALIHQLRRRLRRELLGPLAGRIFPEGKNREYLVLKHTWSFCWIRYEKDPRCSTLVAHHRSRPSESQ